MKSNEKNNCRQKSYIGIYKVCQQPMTKCTDVKQSRNYDPGKYWKMDICSYVACWDANRIFHSSWISWCPEITQESHNHISHKNPSCHLYRLFRSSRPELGPISILWGATSSCGKDAAIPSVISDLESTSSWTDERKTAIKAFVHGKDISVPPADGSSNLLLNYF